MAVGEGEAFRMALRGLSIRMRCATAPAIARKTRRLVRGWSWRRRRMVPLRHESGTDGEDDGDREDDADESLVSTLRAQQARSVTEESVLTGVRWLGKRRSLREYPSFTVRL